MGVQGLWELLAPVGRRVSVETLSGKRLAIDASIWMIQFMKAMRDERGEMVSNAHILGFFRRICKLLFLRTKPVFVFDGGTPALKRRTVAARRRHRENARAKIRKTAEKLLLNHLKSRKLEELAEEIKKSKSEVKEDIKDKQVASEDDGSLGLGKANSYKQSSGFDKAINQERLDELLAASISAEEEAKLAGHESVPTEDIKYEEEGEGGEEEEMIFPVNSGNIDPAVLASLPPSMQLDLLDQMRERLMADNRQKYQKIKKVPAKFSELQIQSYLKTVAFRREIDEVQKCASGQGFGGLQTSRIASEANREYIFSSSFIGDKQMLTPTGTEKNGGIVNQEMRTALDATKRKLFMTPSKSTGDMSLDVATRELSQDVETYLDERGRVRVSRVRGLGIRMTRDLQRNLDLMKEHEKVFLKKDFNKIPETVSNNDASDFPKGQSQTYCIPNPSLVNEKYNHCTSASIATEGIYEEIMSNTGKSATVPAKEAAIEISFSEDEIGSKTMVDDFFMNLVSENPATELFSESLFLEKNKDDVEQGIWEDGMVGEQNLRLKGDDIQSSFVESAGCEEDIWVVGEQNFTLEVDNIQSSFVGSKLGEEDEVLWEDGASLVAHLEENEKAVSRGSLEEEADLKEAIRRSLEDIKSKQPSSAVPVEANMATTIEDQNSLISVKNDPNIEFRIEGNQLQSDMIAFFEEKRCFGRSNAHQFVASPNEILSTCPFPAGRFDGETTQKDDENNVAVSNSDVGLTHDSHFMEPTINQSSQENLCKIASNLVIDDSNMGKADECVLENHPNFENPDSRLDTSLGNVLKNSLAFLSTNNSRIKSSMSSSSGATLGIGISAVSSTEKMVASIDEIQQLADNDVYKDSAGGLSFIDQTSMQEEHKIAASEANLHDEISFLKQERSFLGDEQRKLERNAESVSSEMFAECQELLQMFGLPYIIAPMEAEAQCAYMEMNKLVDGIVTDDSDVFLFGARNVYKNIFDDRKYVETYFMKDIETELGLSRDKLIRIALLLGSDYTEGVSGIGIVNAIEVINAFPEKDGLLKFKEWVESPDISILRGSQYGGNLNERSSNTNGNSADGMETNIVCSASKDGVLGNDQPSDNAIPDTKKKLIFMDKHRNVSKNWHFPPSFPSESVIIAYISPQIDESIEPFTWGKPDLPLLRKICWEKFGWPTQKADDLLLPVLKEYNKHETQLRMEAFYSFNERFAKIRSQRIKKAVKGITGISSSGLTDIGGSSSKRKRGITLCNNEQSLLENDTDRPNKNERKSSKQSRKKTPIRTSPGLSEGSFKRDGVNDERGEIINARSGSEQGVRKARGRGRGKCKRGEDLNERFTESSDEEMHWSNKKVESTPEMRRSTRQRMQVNYAEDNAEINKLPDIPTDEATLEHDKVTMKATALRNDADSFSQEKLSQDYILSGGGFCLEQNEIQEEEQPLPATILRKHSFEQQNDGQSQWPLEDGNCSNFLVTGGVCMDESDPGIAPKSNLEGDSSKEPEEACHESLQVLENFDRKQTLGDGAAQNLLSAMPSLKRKRKK